MSDSAAVKQQSFGQSATVWSKLTGWSASFANGVVETFEGGANSAEKQLAAIQAKYQVAVAAAISRRDMAVASSDFIAEAVWRQAADEMAREASELADEGVAAVQRLATFPISVRRGAAGLLQLVTGAQTLDLSQPVDIALAPGQTDRAFSIVSSQAFEGEPVLELVVTYHHGGEAVESNSLTLTLRDGGEQQGVIAGDYLALAVVNEGAAFTRTREDGSTTTVVERGELMFMRDGFGSRDVGALSPAEANDAFYEHGYEQRCA
ncbi:hypothetical protein [Ramlibacter rhizophilus]|uniref:Uncharacterized protein n=1 Tax=Ramlibacter rhizophilus TaxID=1781167 RepID=A0A4Z0BDA3_9BURK|nr:hypothetical protein [Ramlibacter rhizophilus]TFY96443.1 hypothetical protein EZ242_20665 [Ramlibacter rhizophilus]